MKGVRSSNARRVARNAVKRVGGFACNGFIPLLIACGQYVRFLWCRSRTLNGLVLSLFALRVTRSISIACTRLTAFRGHFLPAASRSLSIACASLTHPTGVRPGTHERRFAQRARSLEVVTAGRGSPAAPQTFLVTKFSSGNKKRPETSSMLFLAVLRTSRHPQSASMLKQSCRSFCYGADIPCLFHLCWQQYSHICL